MEAAAGRIDAKHALSARVRYIEMAMRRINNHVARHVSAPCEVHVDVSPHVGPAVVDNRRAMQLIEVETHQPPAQAVHVPHNVAVHARAVPGVDAVAGGREQLGGTRRCRPAPTST